MTKKVKHNRHNSPNSHHNSSNSRHNTPNSHQKSPPSPNLALKNPTLLIYLSVLSAASLLLANLAAVKIWSFFTIPVDAGILIFPLSYILGDLIMEFYGRRLARHVIFASLAINLLATATFFLATLLPSHPDWHHSAAFATIFTSTPRIILASLLAYLASQLANNLIFDRLRRHTSQSSNPQPPSPHSPSLPPFNSRHFLLRSLGSSAAARFIDIFIFEFIAFFGILPLADFPAQFLFAYLAGMCLEFLFAPLTLLLIKFIRKFLL